MKKVSFLLFIVVVTATITHAQDQKKNMITKVSAAQNGGNQKRLNPQASPPKADNAIKAQGSGSEKMLNPQPLPPKADKGAGERSIIIVSGSPEKKTQNGGSEKMLNPQPLPPKEDKAIKAQSSGSEKMLNPQPLPPKADKRIKVQN